MIYVWNDKYGLYEIWTREEIDSAFGLDVREEDEVQMGPGSPTIYPPQAAAKQQLM